MNYRIEAFEVLLNEDCILKRYYPLIPYKYGLIASLGEMGCHTKEECMQFSDEAFSQTGLPNQEMFCLFKRFLSLYDVKESKYKDIDKTLLTEREVDIYRKLYQLPGVKSIRAKLYYDAGYDSLEKIATASVHRIITDISDVISMQKLNLTVPLVKEVKTHIAVAKALTEYAV